MPLQGGTVEDCLSQEHPTFLAAALSAPLAILHATLHDIAASQTFRAACASAARLQRSTDSMWRGALHCTSRVKLLSHGLRIHLWPQCTLLADIAASHDAVAPQQDGSDAAAAGTPAASASQRSQTARPSAKRRSTASAQAAGLQEQDERKFAFALEVGIKDRELTVAEDPDTASMWQAADVALHCPDALPSALELDAASGDLDPLLLVRACLCPFSYLPA